MSKATKIIAGLGVVAGLGVAAMPAFTYAEASVNGNVDLYAEINPAIAMTIEGNNDDGDPYNPDVDPDTTWADAHGEVTVFNPSAIGGSTFDGLTLPSVPTTVASSSYVALNPNAAATTTSTVTVYTNSDAGYNLKVRSISEQNSTATAAMYNAAGDSIAAGVITETGGNIDGGLGLWSYKTDQAAASTETGIVANSAWTAMATTDATIRNTATRTNNGSATTVTYGISADDDQAVGVYNVTLKYTATTNE